MLEKGIKISDISPDTLSDAVFEDRVCPVILEVIDLTGLFMQLPDSKLLDYFDNCCILSSKYLPIKKALAKKIFDRH